MPRQLTALLAVACISIACGEPTPTQTVGLAIHGGDHDRPYFHDFGTVIDGESPSHTFRLTNTESAAVNLMRLIPACSCTVPTVRVIEENGQITKVSPRATSPMCAIPPGAALEIDVTMDTSRIRRKNTDRLSTISLLTDSKIAAAYTLELHVKVQQLIQATPANLDLGEIPTNEAGRGQIVVIVAVPDADVSLSAAKALSPELTVDSKEEERLGRQVWLVDVALDPGMPLGMWTGAIQLLVDAPAFDPPKRTIEVPVRATVVEDIILRPRRAFHVRKNIQAIEYNVTALIPGARFIVSSATLFNCPEGLYTTTFTPDGPDIHGRASRWSIQVQPTGKAYAEPVNAKLTVSLDSGEVLESALLGR